MILSVCGCYFDSNLIWGISELAQNEDGTYYGIINGMKSSVSSKDPEDQEKFQREYNHLLQCWVAGRKENS